MSRKRLTHNRIKASAEHPFDGSWVIRLRLLRVDQPFGNPDEFVIFVNQCHQNTSVWILDWVPAFPKDAHGLAQFDGTHLYEHADPRQGEPKIGTLIFNYGRNEVRNFLLGNALMARRVSH